MTVERIKFTNPTAEASGRYEEHIRSAAKRRLPIMQPGSIAGRDVVICGSGPSLDVLWPKVAAARAKGAIICACKGALRYLYRHEVTIDYSVSIDPGAHIACDERMYRIPGVEYIMASSSNPEVFDYLLAADCAVTIFHSATGYNSKSASRGLPYNEETLYQSLFPPPHHIVCGGYNVVNRAVGCMRYMGAANITLIGVDSGWRDGQVAYCGNTPELRPKVQMCDHGMINGKPWHTYADMLASALDLVRMVRDDPSIRILGETMPGSILEKLAPMPREEQDAFLHHCGHFEK